MLCSLNDRSCLKTWALFFFIVLAIFSVTYEDIGLTREMCCRPLGKEKKDSCRARLSEPFYLVLKLKESLNIQS